MLRERPILMNWLDMETGVRTNNWFCMSKCRAVCQAVYGGGE